jgi:excinuclease ABC subunit C
MEYQKTLKEKILSAPDSPGVYLMKDKTGKVIYAGKAKSLKKRLDSYLGGDLEAKTAAMVSNALDIEFRLTQTEGLALLLEAALIHKYKPKYNVALRDDKSFPFVKITDEEFPAVCITRKVETDAARYFGPYTNAKLLRQALKVIRNYFPYRSCKKLPKKPCIYYRIRLSPAPCARRINKAEYAKTIKSISLILEGRCDSLIKKLTKEMRLMARQRNFEEAAALRDKILSLSSLGSEYHIPNAGLSDLKELLGLKRLPIRIEGFDVSDISGKEACASMVSFYDGMPDKNNYRRFRIKSVEGIDDYAMIREVVARRYSRLIKEGIFLPDLILIDGGKAHLESAQRELMKLGLKVPLVSIAKEEENIYTTARPQPLRLSHDTPALNLIRRVRNEAHRFALSYHHILRRKRMIGR